jgi:aspartate carbamoyltransferase catalytic subunit
MTATKSVEPAPQKVALPPRKHILDLDDFSPEEISQVLETAGALSEVLNRPISKVPALRGKTVLTLFLEPSTRTRASFERAAKALSADIINLSGSESSAKKGESLIDTARTMQAMGANIIIMRHAMSGAPYLLAQHTDLSVINAGDGWHAHPSQALLDLYTMRERFGKIAGLKVVIVGDVLHSRVARSNIWGLRKMGADVVLAAPPTLLPEEAIEAFAGELPGRLSIEFDLDRAVAGADVLMALRVQKERLAADGSMNFRDYILAYQVNEERLHKANPGAMLMHPGPMNEGVEVSHSLAYSDRSLVETQVKNGVAVRMALLFRLVGASGVDA